MREIVVNDHAVEILHIFHLHGRFRQPFLDHLGTGVSATDETDGAVPFTVDTSAVDLETPGFSEVEDGMVTVTLKREGALNTVVTATVRTAGGSAVAGRDYSEVDREIFFPFGVSEFPLQIPVSTAYFDGDASFTLELEAGDGCTVDGNTTAEVTLHGDSSARPEGTEPGLQGDVVQSLITLRTGPEVPVATPYEAGNEDDDFEGTNAYDSATSSWRMQWKGDDTKGTVGAIWQLTEDEDPFWYSGVRINWEHVGSDATIIATVFGDHLTYFSTDFVDDYEYYPTIMDYLKAWGDRGRMVEVDGGQIYSYRAKLAFVNRLSKELADAVNLGFAKIP